MSHNLVIQETDKGSFYCRSMSAQSIDLAQKLEKCHSCKNSSTKAVICASGMSAISLSLHSILSQHKSEKINLIRGDELYCDTPRLTKSLHETYNFTEYLLNVNDTEEINRVFDNLRSDINILFLESASNPSGDVFDFRMIPALRKKMKKLYVIVDNTWLTHVIFNPFDYDVDMVVLSLTKYYSGSQCICGAIVCKNKYFNKLFNCVKINGLHVSPIHCEMVSQAMDTIEDRMLKSSETTIKVAQYLAGLKGFSVRHASLPTDPSSKLSTLLYHKWENSIVYPSVISFMVPMKLNDAVAWMKSSGIKYETSYGCSYSRFDPWPIAIGDEKTLCRLAIGYDDSYQDIVSKINA